MVYKTETVDVTIKFKVYNITVLDGVIPALLHKLAGRTDLGFGAQFLKVAILHHISRNKTSFKVRATRKISFVS